MSSYKGKNKSKEMNMLKIGDFSRLSRVTVKALRYYDEINLLKPDLISQDNGYRYYHPDKLAVASEIQNLKELGFSLEEISMILITNPSKEQLFNLLSAKKELVLIGIKSEQNRLFKLDSLIKNLSMELIMEKVIIKDLPEVIVASCRTILPEYNALHTVCPAMGEKMRRQGAVCSEPAYCFNIYHDGEYKEKDIDVEICEAVVDFCADGEGVIYKKIAGVPAAACLYHHGAYQKLGKSYSLIFKWLAENGYEVADSPRESYIDGCWNKESEEEWLTEIQVPVKKIV